MHIVYKLTAYNTLPAQKAITLRAIWPDGTDATVQTGVKVTFTWKQ